MKLDKLYRAVVDIGIKNDPRGKAAITRLLKEEKDKHKGLKPKETEYFDKDRLFNPFADTRVLNGSPNAEVRKIIVGIDMDVGELLLTHTLNKDSAKKIDLVLSHHPSGYALAQLADVMRVQADLLAQFGIAVSAAEQLMEKRISEIERRLMPVNHSRTVDAAKALGLAMMCVHTPADNCVSTYVQRALDKAKPYRLRDLLNMLLDIPEYKAAAKAQVPPKIVSGSDSSQCGKVFVDMTGGTEGSKEIFAKLSGSGVSTLVGMHISEEHLENAKKANMNIVIAGHIASDVLGLNLLFDELEKSEKLEFVAVSGYERIRRTRAK